MVVVQQTGFLHHWKGKEGVPEEEGGGEGEVHLLLVGAREVVAELGSQLWAVGEEVEGQQNRGEVGKMRVKVVVGSLEAQILRAVAGVERPSLEEAAEGQAVEQTRVWSQVESPEEELVVGGLG